MSNLEAALRRALAKGDITDPEFRRKVYAAAANAMEKSLEADPSIPEETIVARRKGLAAVISGIEDEIEGQVPSVAAEPAPAETVAPVDPPVAPARRADPEPRMDYPVAPVAAPPVDSGPRLRAEPAFEDTSAAPQVAPDAVERPKKAVKPAKKTPEKKARKHPFAAGFSILVAVAAVIIGFVFVWTTGAFQSAEERDTSIPNPTPRLEAENSVGSGPRAPALAAEGTPEERAAAEGWVTIFSPDNPTTLALARGAQASIESDPFGDFARVVTPTPEAEIQVDVPVGTLNDLQGGPVQIDIVARAQEGEATEMSVTCNFGVLGDCGRRRFIVGQSPAEYLFRIDLPEAGTVESGGIVQIRADINDNSRALDILAVRIRAAGGR